MKPLIPALLVAALLAGCAKSVPVALPKAKMPAECRIGSASELPAVPALTGKVASPDAVNRHWARHWRLTARPAYRRLYRANAVCSRYAQGV